MADCTLSATELKALLDAWLGEDHQLQTRLDNPAELGSRVSARRRDVSLQSKVPRGARAMDIFTTLVQSCKKLGLSAYAYLRDRLLQAHEIPCLAILVRAAAAGG